jgi:hypothetical protein
MQLATKLLKLRLVQFGTGVNGDWKDDDLIIDSKCYYPKKFGISVWGEKIDNSQVVIGNINATNFEIAISEYSGRWYSDVKSGKVSCQMETSSKKLDGALPLDLNDNEDLGLPLIFCADTLHS